MTGRMVCLLPGGPLMTGVPGSKLSYVLDDIQEKFEESIRVNVRPCFCTCGFSLFTKNIAGTAAFSVPAISNRLSVGSTR